MILRCFCFTIAFALTSTTSYAADFFNLDFELGAATPPLSPQTPNNIPAISAINAGNALPGWTVRLDTTISNTIWSGAFSPLDWTSISFISSNALNGNNSVQLYGVKGGPSDPDTASISQFGLIPNGSNSLQFLISPVFVSTHATPAVEINGTRVPVSLLSSNGNLRTMGVDVSAYAGTNVNLAFLAEPGPELDPVDSQNVFILDQIQFSPQVIPEPGSIAIFIGAILGFVSYRKRTESKLAEHSRN